VVRTMPVRRRSVRLIRWRMGASCLEMRGFDYLT
jgi:hypothetical protein